MNTTNPLWTVRLLNALALVLISFLFGALTILVWKTLVGPEPPQFWDGIVFGFAVASLASFVLAVAALWGVVHPHEDLMVTISVLSGLNSLGMLWQRFTYAPFSSELYGPTLVFVPCFVLSSVWFVHKMLQDDS